MKRLMLALVILGCGTSGLLALHRATARLRSGAERTRTILLAETQHLAQMRLQFKALTGQVRKLTRKFESQEGLTTTSGPDGLDEIPTGAGHLTPGQSEKLLAELGFNWASSGDYLIVSKDTLRAISLDGMRGSQLGAAAAQVLAITPDERTRIETMTQQLMQNYSAWARAHVQRVEPNGDMVAKYILPADPDFSLSLSNDFAATVLGTLGLERGRLLLDYSQSWMQNLGMSGADASDSLTVTRYPSATEPHYSLELRYAGNSMTTDVSPHQEFPPAFLPLFPNGWPDLAQREGFALPKEFAK